MKTIVKNALAVIGGWLSGSALNMGLVTIGHVVYPIESLSDPNDLEALAAIMPTLSTEYFIFPFLAHAGGSFLGGLVAGLFAANRHMLFALIVGAIFFLGGIVVAYLIPAPSWFVLLDLIVAYLPMAWLGGLLAGKFSRTQQV